MNRCHSLSVARRPFGLGRRIAFVLAAALLAGCGMKAPKMEMPKLPPPPPPPAELVLDVSASPKMNPSSGGQAAPLLVRIYELTADGGFMAADLDKLLSADQSALGSDLLARDEARFKPGERRQITKTLNPATGALGVLAAYRVTDGVRWRAAVPILANKVNQLKLDLGPQEITLAPAH